MVTRRAVVGSAECESRARVEVRAGTGLWTVLPSSGKHCERFAKRNLEGQAEEIEQEELAPQEEPA